VITFAVVEDSKSLKKLSKGVKDAVYLAVSTDLDSSKFEEGGQFMAPVSATSIWFSEEDYDRFANEYIRYLSDPRIMYMLSLFLYRSIVQPVYFCCSKEEKDVPYMKVLRRFIIDHMGIPKKYVTKYSKSGNDFIAYDQKTIDHICRMRTIMRSKADEAAKVLSFK